MVPAGILSHRSNSYRFGFKVQEERNEMKGASRTSYARILEV